MIKVGAITIGQSPRNDVTPDIIPILGENIELIQAGGLDGLTRDQIEKFSPSEGDYILVSKLNDGTSVRFAEKHILPRLQQCIYDLEEKGAELILFLCTGDFPDIFKSRVPLIFPCHVLNALVPVLSSKSKIAVVTPDKSQVMQCENKWKNYVKEVTAVPASPYADNKELGEAAKIIKDLDVDVVVMDCIGYTEEMKQKLRSASGKNIILSRTIVARAVREMLD
ncbi:AroM family protein [Clostridium culturomicium]|uniref:AroM family protein n=1 Tax=Clostridium culturomicium TaxID=1499683 RepID=UPI0038575612